MKKRLLTLLLTAFVPFAIMAQKADRDQAKNLSSSNAVKTLSTCPVHTPDHFSFSKYAPCDSLKTTYIGGNGYDGVWFNVVAVQDIMVKKIYSTFNGPGTAKIYYKTGSWVGFENTPAAWTYIDSAAILFTAVGSPSEIPIHVNVQINAGDTMAFYVTSSDGVMGIDYTNGTAQNNVYAQDSYLKILEGRGGEYPFGAGYTPRVFNGYIDYCQYVPQVCDTLSTTWAGGNGQNGVMFEVTALADITINQFYAAVVGSGTVKIYEKSGTYVGFETTPASWTLVDSAYVVSSGAGTATLLPINADINVTTAQSHSFYLTGNGDGLDFDYTNGTTEGAVFCSDAYLAIKEGKGMQYPFSGLYTPRVFNGSIDYCYESAVSVPEKNIYGISVYPNPFTSVFTVTRGSAEKDLQIYVFDMMGRMVYTQRITEDAQQIDLSNQPSGMFFYNITENGNKVKTGKLIKQ